MAHGADPVVLVVDDDESVLDMTCRSLDRAGVANIRARDFAELAAALEGRKPDLILMDVQMPELFGDDVAAVLRDARGIQSRIYLYSSLDEDELKQRATEAGVDGYICKTAGLSVMVAEVQRILSGDQS